MSHYEISPREKEDEERRWRYEHDMDLMCEEDERGTHHLQSGQTEMTDG